jgi:tetratricopeptide (TPR) repeat protein
MKTIIFNFLTILFFNYSPGLADGFEDYMGKGDSFYKSFNFVAAIEQYERAYAISAEEFYVLLKLTRAYNDLGEEYYEKRDKKNAERSVNKALKYAEEFQKKFPDSSQVYAYLAWSYGNVALYKGGNEKVKLAHKIKENAEESIRRNPDNYLPYIILGIYHRQIASLSWLEKLFAETFFGDVPEGTLEESEKYLLEALELNPGVVIATFHLSLAYREMGEDEKEIQMLKKVLDLPEKDFRDKYAKRKAERRLRELMD